MWRTVKAVLWAFFGVRKQSDYDQDIQQIKLPVVIVVGIVLCVALVVGLWLIVQIVLPKSPIATVSKVSTEPKANLTVLVTARQGLWHYEYSGQTIGAKNISFTSKATNPVSPQYKAGSQVTVTQPLVLPVGQPIALRLTSDDLVHTWFVPDLRVKQDAIPGFKSSQTIMLERAGTFYGHCNAKCGRKHDEMAIAIQAISADEFATWVSGR
jgi:cytochrome c oxidase subunit II